jgi:hypothetical protein
MLSKSQPVDVVAIDSDSLDRDETFPEAYAFYIELSSEPDNIWQGYLAKWGSALKAAQRKISVEGDRLRLVFVYGDNIRQYANYATWLVSWVNERVAEHNKKIALLEKEELGRKETDRRKEEHILQELRQVKSEKLMPSSELNLKELVSAYENNRIVYEGYRNSIIKIKGFVKEIEVKPNYIVLTDEYKSRNSVFCVFDKEHDYELKRLKKGQIVTVVGEFEGSVIQLSMRHCRLVT